MKERPTLVEYFMAIAELASTRSTCLKRQVGSVIVRNNRILSTGYNGAPVGVPHCTEDTCLRKNTLSGEGLSECMASHSEANAIANAANEGIKLKNSILFCTHKPCLSCAKLIINAGINLVFYKYGYNSPITESRLVEPGYIRFVDVTDINNLAIYKEYDNKG
jgi:dCMP deaminase